MPRKQTSPAAEDVELTAAVLDDVEAPDEADPADELQDEPIKSTPTPEAADLPEPTQSIRDQVTAEFNDRQREREEELERCRTRYLKTLRAMPKGKAVDPAALDGLISAACDAEVSKELMFEHLGVFEKYAGYAMTLHGTNQAEISRELGDANAAMTELERRHKEEYLAARSRISAARDKHTQLGLAIGYIENLNLSYPDLFEYESGDVCPHLIGCGPIRHEARATDSA